MTDVRISSKYFEFHLTAKLPTRDSSSKPSGFSVGMTGLRGMTFSKLVILNVVATEIIK